ncbi:MAG: arylsulfatase, partial [Bacteroidota bacterium]
MKRIGQLWISLSALFLLALPLKAQRPPNVILIMTDDQGIGDLGCHGNPWLKTPNLDSLYDQSVRLTDFHVSPYCTPTRSALMTGLYPVNNGAWATYKGRDALSSQAVTMADIFQQNGYQTAMFGKWHLGDNYPVRPTDCGFKLAVQHRAGGVGELSDYWGNTYVDDVYFVNNEPRPFTGYCTDVWFQEAMHYMDTLREGPFFLYLPTNAPHSPLYVDSSYAAPYKHLEGSDIISANMYGMIANIDENMGKLGRFLDQKGLAENTILIFMTDNGTNYGYSRNGKVGYNKGFRGIKGDKLEGGHRVPFFIRWPAQNMGSGKDLEVLSAHVDVIPTLMGLCGFTGVDDHAWDGVDLSSLLLGQSAEIPDRSVFVHHRQDWRPPEQVMRSCILYQDWRLINGKLLFDISQDTLQKRDLAKEHPALVSRLLQQNQAFLDEAEARVEFQEFPSPVLGGV